MPIFVNDEFSWGWITEVKTRWNVINILLCHLNGQFFVGPKPLTDFFMNKLSLKDDSSCQASIFSQNTQNPMLQKVKVMDYIHFFQKPQAPRISYQFFRNTRHCKYLTLAAFMLFLVNAKTKLLKNSILLSMYHLVHHVEPAGKIRSFPSCKYRYFPYVDSHICNSWECEK